MDYPWGIRCSTDASVGGIACGQREAKQPSFKNEEDLEGQDSVQAGGKAIC
jgi:hypothetical protein